MVIDEHVTWLQIGLGRELRATRCEIAAVRDNLLGECTTTGVYPAHRRWGPQEKLQSETRHGLSDQ